MFTLKLLFSLALSWSSEQQCLADVMHAEARGESSEQRIAVAAVVINRARKANRSLCRTTKQPFQFARLHNPSTLEANIATVIYPFLPQHYRENYFFHSGRTKSRNHYDERIRGGNHFYAA